MNYTKFLADYASASKLDAETLYALYILLGDNLLLTLNLLQGRTIKFPTLKRVTNSLSSKVEFLELTKSKYKTSLGWKSATSLVDGDMFVSDSGVVKCLGAPVSLFGKVYVAVQPCNEVIV